MSAPDVPIVQRRIFGTTTRLQSFPAATLVEIQYEPGAFLPPHEHASCVFLLTVSGNFEETVERRMRVRAPRQLVYRPAGERHSQRFFGEGATCFAIEPAGNQEHGFKDAARDGRLDGLPQLFAMRLYDEFLRPRNPALVVEELVAGIASRGDTDRACERSPVWLPRAIDLIEARLSTTIRLHDLAAEVDRHPVHVSRCFRRRFGCDVAEFVKRRRVHEACRRIRETRDSLSAIAAAVGFSDQSHMGRAFMDVMRRSPGSYRR